MFKFKLAVLFVLLAALFGASSAQAQNQSVSFVFPQVADGVFPDGSSYQSTLMVQNPDSYTRQICTLQMYGLSTNFKNESGSTLSPSADNSLKFIVPADGWAVLKTPGTQQFQQGYATLNCFGIVYASLLFSNFSNGGKIGEATVLGVESWSKFKLTADQTGGARLGIAIANDSDISANFQIILRKSDGTTFGTKTITVGPRTSLAKFLDELIPSSGNQILEVRIERGGGATAILYDSAVVGLRYTGSVFTTIPAVKGSL